VAPDIRRERLGMLNGLLSAHLEALTVMLNHIPEPSLRQTLTYDQGRGFKMPIEVFAEHLDAVIESRRAIKH
jgi:hypothetical protein